MASASCGRSILNSSTKASKRACCWRLFIPRSGCLFLQRQMHALVAAVLLWVARLDALDGDAEPQPPHREFGEIKEAVWTGERHAIVRPDRLGQAALLEELLEGGDGKVLAGRFKGFAEQEKARGVVGDDQRKAVLAIAELGLALRLRGGKLLKSAHQRSF